MNQRKTLIKVTAEKKSTITFRIKSAQNSLVLNVFKENKPVYIFYRRNIFETFDSRYLRVFDRCEYVKHRQFEIFQLAI